MQRELRIGNAGLEEIQELMDVRGDGLDLALLKTVAAALLLQRCVRPVLIKVEIQSCRIVFKAFTAADGAKELDFLLTDDDKLVIRLQEFQR